MPIIYSCDVCSKELPEEDMAIHFIERCNSHSIERGYRYLNLATLNNTAMGTPAIGSDMGLALRIVDGKIRILVACRGKCQNELDKLYTISGKEKFNEIIELIPEHPDSIANGEKMDNSIKAVCQDLKEIIDEKLRDITTRKGELPN